MQKHSALDIATLQDRYARGTLTPALLIDELLARAAENAAYNIWTRLLSREEIQVYLDQLQARLNHTAAKNLPLYGVPFAIKDNIDLADIPTTAGCVEFSYTPKQSAFVVEKLIAAGAIPIGKTNLDQFATGLVGTRTEEAVGVCKNSYDPTYISGGSSSGSAVAVARGIVSFSLGSDTAGSGRVPAAFNNLLGVKPTKGLLSTSGMLPACRSLDCMSIFALNPDDAGRVLALASGYDDNDPYSKRQTPGQCPVNPAFVFGVPRADQLEFFGDANYKNLFEQALGKFESMGGTLKYIDFGPFIECARLLYEGPWVAERYAAIENLVANNPAALHPTVRNIIEPAAELTAVAAFKAEYRRAELQRHAEKLLEPLDFVLTPTAGTHYRIADVMSEPVRLNSNLGYYTNFMNLMDLAAVAVPAGFTAAELPFGVTLFAEAYSDQHLLQHAAAFLKHTDFQLAASHTHWQPQPHMPEENGQTLSLAVCGAHLDGMPLNHQLRELGATLETATHTAPCYRLYALAGGPPHRPGLVRDESNGCSIQVEVWRLPKGSVGEFLQQIPPPLGIGSVELENSRRVQGFICEPYGLAGAEDISGLGGWRNYMEEN